MGERWIHRGVGREFGDIGVKCLRPAVSGDRGLQSQPMGEPECEEKWANGTAEHRVSVGEGGSFEQGCRQEGL